jgi:hypothetical protein
VRFIKIALSLVPLAACAVESSPVDIGRGFPDAGQAQAFAPPAGDAGVDSPVETAMCVATLCPVPYATCGKLHACGTNLSNDRDHCGACDNACPDFAALDMKARCVEGRCRYECDDGDHMNCNGLVEDGCEVNFKSDPSNCGACGHECGPGVRCFQGICGCPSGQTDCNGRCADLNNDNRNCAECGRRCPNWTTAGWPAPPPNMDYGCAGGECQRLKCREGFRDCDGDLSNGCEINIETDTSNCGECGKACASGQLCAIPKNGKVPSCLCGPGLTLCGGGGEDYSCVDLLNDRENCGACNNNCGTSSKLATCEQGRCRDSCAPNFADCDGDPSNGCEVNLMIDGSNCGQCGRWCNTTAGQPCIEGACLMAECDAGQGPQ